jgi:hypothetical protein
MDYITFTILSRLQFIPAAFGAVGIRVVNGRNSPFGPLEPTDATPLMVFWVVQQVII